jgi:hypothetical protein
MCSATQKGLRVRRSNEEVKEGIGRRSAMGPGKPYWKRPLGSTRAGCLSVLYESGRLGRGTGAGIGAAGVRTVVVVVDVTVLVGVGFLLEYIAAVRAAPAAALEAAMMARVALDMVCCSA